MRVAVRRTVATVVATGIALVATAGVAFAGNTFQSYSVVAPKLLGGYGYSSYQTKGVENYDGDLNSVSVGGNYTATTCMAGSSMCLPFTHVDIDDNMSVKLPNLWGEGAQVRAEFSTPPTTFVDVLCTGTWRSF